jgi:hypothetical protein
MECGGLPPLSPNLYVRQQNALGEACLAGFASLVAILSAAKDLSRLSLRHCGKRLYLSRIFLHLSSVTVVSNLLTCATTHNPQPKFAFRPNPL